MNLIIRKEVAQRIGYDAFKDYGIARDAWSWHDSSSIDMSKLSLERLYELEAKLKRFEGVRGVSVMLADILAWRKALYDGASTMRARTVRQFEAILAQYLVNVPGHRLYSRHDEGAMLCYYVNYIEYEPPIEQRDHYRPASVKMHLLYQSVGGQQASTITFLDGDCRNIPVAEALALMGYQIETEELRADYLETLEIFRRTVGQIGKQYWGRGVALPQSNPNDYDRSNNRQFDLDKNGEPSRVVIDVFSEDGKTTSSSGSYVRTYYWPGISAIKTQQPAYDAGKDIDNTPINEDTILERPEIEIPVHPWVVIFHLGKHVRLRCHVRQLEEYIYDKNLADKLVLPADQKALVHLLIETKGGMFEDIVRGKGGGAVVLLAGPPGTGKTLTAEVYAESEERPLYSVQCSQLGIDPAKLESELMRVFERGRRWNAVMLLDEADVYVHERGNSMQQNAIVGVFLRVLELR